MAFEITPQHVSVADAQALADDWYTVAEIMLTHRNFAGLAAFETCANQLLMLAGLPQKPSLGWSDKPPIYKKR